MRNKAIENESEKERKEDKVRSKCPGKKSSGERESLKFEEVRRERERGEQSGQSVNGFSFFSSSHFLERIYSFSSTSQCEGQRNEKVAGGTNSERERGREDMEEK